MSAWKPTGGSMSDMLAAREERRRREAEAERAVSAPPVLSTPDEPSAPRTEPAVREVLSTPPVPSARFVLTKATTGYHRLPNFILDNLLPMLRPNEQIAYLHLWRLCQIDDRGTCLIGFPALAKRCNLSRTATIQAVERLEERGLVERIGAVAKGANAGRGNQYRVSTPAVLSAGDLPSTPKRLSTPGGRMKVKSETKEETAPVAPAPALLHSDHRATLRAFVAERRREGVADVDIWPLAVTFAAEKGIDPALIREAIGA